MKEEISFDLYEILTCSPDASNKEIKQTFRKLALKHHPDKTDEGDREMFCKLEQAYRVLSDPIRRAEYDAQRKQKEFEETSVLLYARLTADELEPSDDPDYLKYSCRCGGEYRVEKSDLEETNCELHIACRDCTLVISIEL